MGDPQGDSGAVIKADLFQNYDSQIQQRERQREEWRQNLIKQMHEQESKDNIVTAAVYRGQSGKADEEEDGRGEGRGKGASTAQGDAGGFHPRE